MTIGIVKKVVLGISVLLLSSLAFAQGKVVVLDLQAAVLSTDVAQQRLQQLENNQEYRALMTRYENLSSDLEALQKDVETNSMTWSEEQRTEKEAEAMKLRQDYEQVVQTLQNGRQRVMQAVMQQLGDRTRDVLAELIEAEKIGLVLNSQSAYHASAEYDITDRVTQLLNQKDQ